jgi:hypothetical protein
MFKGATDKYSKLDEQGIPTHNAAGEELSKKQRQGAEKDFAKRTADFAKVAPACERVGVREMADARCSRLGLQHYGPWPAMAARAACARTCVRFSLR